MPKVSVVIPAYNCERFISGAIDSVFNQTYGNYEIIVVNDGSKDRTAEILSGYGTRITKIDQPNKGPAEARNAGVRAARGEYIAFLDQDDEWLPHKLKAQVELMDKNSRVGLVYSDTYIIRDSEFSHAGTKSRRSFQSRRPYRGMILERLFMDNFISTSSVMVRKECFAKAGMFDPAIVPSEDVGMWLNIAAFYETDYVDMPLVKFRDHVACFSSNKVRTLTHIIDMLNNTLAGHPVLKTSLGRKAAERVSDFHVMLGKAYLSKMKFKEAFGNFNAALRLAGSPAMPFNILFSFIAESFLDLLRRFKTAARA
ncbi:MAG: glycosyltransferase [Candidatus Omnitrophota bacterium]